MGAGLSLVNILYVVQQSTIAPGQILFFFFSHFLNPYSNKKPASVSPFVHGCICVGEANHCQLYIYFLSIFFFSSGTPGLQPCLLIKPRG